MTNVIETNNLTKKFNHHTAVDSVTLSVPNGTVFGFLGPNGAGKTTTVRLLNGLLSPTSGQAYINGIDVFTDGEKVRKLTGVQTDTNVYEALTAWENLETWGKLYDVPSDKLSKKITQLLTLFGLIDRKDNPVGTFSKGMRQKILIARSLIHDPEVLFLDEPASGLDPEAAEEVTHYLKTYIKDGERTVFLCSHRLEEVESICHSIAIINEGKILACGTIEDLRQTLSPDHWFSIELVNPKPEYVSLLTKIRSVSTVQLIDNHLRFTVKDRTTISEVIKNIVEHKGEILSVYPETHSLKDIYFKILPQHGGNDTKSMSS